MTDTRYRAFISYSHTDEASARWIHGALERYRIPKKLVAANHLTSRRLTPIFRDRDELSTSSSLSTAITTALDASDNLIVVCSPAAAASRWVNEEIKAFKALGREDRIFCLIVDGEDGECFPQALVDDEPLAADLRPGGDGKNNAKLKLIAGLLDIEYGSLKDREQRRRTQMLGLASAASLALAGVMTALTVKSVIAEREAEQSRLVAAAALKDAESVANFLSTMLAEINVEAMGQSILTDLSEQAGDRALPAGLNGSNTARLLLDKHVLARAVDSVESQFAGQPKISARLERAIGDSYQTIGLFADAVERQRTAAEQYTAEYGAQDERTIEAEIALGIAYVYNGQLDESAEHLEHAVSTADGAFGARHETVLAAKNALAVTYTDMAKLEEARSIFIEIDAIHNELFGSDDKRTIDVRTNYGWLLYELGEYTEAEAIFEPLLETRRRVEGPESKGTTEVLNNLGLVYRRLGRMAESEAMHREELEISQRVTGEDHPETLITMLNLSRLLMNMERLDEAGAMVDDARARVRHALPPVHPLTAAMVMLQGEIALAKGDTASTRERYEEAIVIYTAIFGAEHSRVTGVEDKLVVLP